MKINKKSIFVTSWLLVAVFLTGCGLTANQVTMVQSFGAATENIGKLAEAEFTNTRNEIIEMNKALAALEKSSSYKDFDYPTSSESAARRIAASKALKLYGKSLVMLVTEDRTANLQKAANSLTENAIIVLGKEDLSVREAINKIIVGFGSFWVKKNKADAAKEIILAYDKPVKEMADLLRKDFSIGNGANGYMQAYYTTSSQLRSISDKLLDDKDTQYSVLERERFVYALSLSKRAKRRAEEISKKANNSITSLEKANVELVKAMKEENCSTEEIKAYAKQVEEFVNLYQVLTK